MRVNYFFYLKNKLLANTLKLFRGIGLSSFTFKLYSENLATIFCPSVRRWLPVLKGIFLWGSLLGNILSPNSKMLLRGNNLFSRRMTEIRNENVSFNFYLISAFEIFQYALYSNISTNVFSA